MIDVMMTSLMEKIPHADAHFIRMMLYNKLGQIAANMRVNMEFYDGAIVPLNIYQINLAPSGYSKGKVNNLIEDSITKGFEDKFFEVAADVIEESLDLKAERVSANMGIEKQQARADIDEHFNKLPKFLYSFPDATLEGIKSSREKLTMSEIGATNLEMDELAINMDKMADILGIFMEAYDRGRAKSKLIKVNSNTQSGEVPANLLAFGTATSLLNGSRKEEQFLDMLRQGFARRCFFGYIEKYDIDNAMSPEEELHMAQNRDSVEALQEVNEYLASLATTVWHDSTVTMGRPVALTLIKLKQEAEVRASELKDHQELDKFYIVHSYWRIAKLAGILAFIDKSPEIMMEHLILAVRHDEDSEKAFKRMIETPPSYERLFHHIMDIGKRMTYTDLHKDLYFYSSATKGQKDEMLKMAQAFAFTQNAMIRTSFRDGVDFVEGQYMESNDGSKIILSISTELAEGYVPKLSKWDDLGEMLSSHFEYSNHHFRDEYRDHEHALEQFNMIIIDVDDGMPLATAMEAMSGYEYIMGTTKSHQKDKNGFVCDRYRILIPLECTIELNRDDYSQFMTNIFDWLPFEPDRACKDIARKFSGYTEAEVFKNEGMKIDPLDFVPSTTRQEKTAERVKDLGDIDGLMKWFLLNTEKGGRNNQVHRFTMALADGGIPQEEVINRVIHMNSMLDEPLPERELYDSVFKTLSKKLQED